MYFRKWKLGAALLCIPAILVLAGCACKKATPSGAMAAEPQPVNLAAQLLPPNAKPGECYAKAFVPEQFETRTETVCTREASERLEIVPARYEWVEEQVVVKDASVRYEEVPAEFGVREQVIQTDPGHTGWHADYSGRCVGGGTENCKAKEVFCLVSHPPVERTINTQVQTKPPTVREVVTPAEYQTVRRYKMVAPATTRRIAIPAEYTSVEKTTKVADSRVEWQRVDCQLESRTETSLRTRWPAPVSHPDRELASLDQSSRP
jgi:hypothetical protein